jgi:SagB-type dehydrogenase family enzyme
MNNKYRGLNAVASYERQEESVSEIFHEGSKMKRIDGVAWGKRFESIRSNPDIVKAMSKSYKIYKNHSSIPLDTVFPDTDQSFEEILVARRTTREFSGENITFNELSKILYFTYGITLSFKAFESHGIFFHAPQYIENTEAIKTAQDIDGYQSFRAPASAGGLYPLEIYPVVHCVDGLEPGIYHYNVREHTLEILKTGNYSKVVADLTFNQDWQSKASVHFIVTAMFDRTRFKYFERGYRFVMIDAGHMMENLYLVTTSLNLGVAALGGFYDDEVNELLDIDGINEAAIYMSLVGRHQDPKATVLEKCRLFVRDE